MDEILAQLGWGDGLRIPVANAENKTLELEVQQKQKEKENLQSTLEDLNERVCGMNKHLNNVKQQLDQNQNLLFAHNSQKTEEENLVRLAKMEENTLTNDIKKIKKEQEEVVSRQNAIQADIDRCLQHLDKLNSTIKWDKDALVAWDEEVSRSEDDTLMLEKFVKEDQTKFKELEMKRQSLGLEVESKRHRLINLKNDVSSMEQSLEKTVQMFHKQHLERRNLVSQWERSVRVLHQRDEDINGVIEEMSNLKTLAKERLKDLEEQKTFYENEVKNNKELDVEIENLNKQMVETKEKIKLIESIVAEENHEYASLKTVLATTTTQWHNEVTKRKHILNGMQAKAEKIEELKAKTGELVKEFEMTRRKTATTFEKEKQIQGLIEEEKKMLNQYSLEFQRLDDLMFQVIQQTKELKDGIKLQVATISHTEVCTQSFRKHIAKAKEEFNRQREILYNMDFAYMEKNIQLNRMLGYVKTKDSEKDKKKLIELEAIQKKVTATNLLLTKEVARLEDDMRRFALELEGNAKEQNYLRNKRQEHMLVLEGGQKQLKALIALNQSKQVDENVLKLRVRQAEKMIDAVGGKVFCLEKQRLELEEVMKEREVEITTMRDILNVRRRVLNEQYANLNSRINLAKIKVEHLKSKYEVAVLKLGKDENGEPQSACYMKMKLSQEKFDLQETGDKLDSKIKRTEKEIQAMENTLKVVNATNKAFKNNLLSGNTSCKDQMELDELEGTRLRLVKEYQERKKYLKELTTLTEELEKEYQEKVAKEESIRNEWRDKENQLAELKRELAEQEEKLDRADKQLRKLIREIRGTTIQKFQTVEEKDIELRELMEQNEYGLQQLAELVAKTYDTGPVVIRYLTEKGLTLPMLKSPSGSVKCPSTSSTVSTARSSVSTARSSKSSGSEASRTSSCLITPSVVTLDSAKISDKSKSRLEMKTSVVETRSTRDIGSLLMNLRKSSSDT